jgi:hypothetical protein
VLEKQFPELPDPDPDNEIERELSDYSEPY